MPQITVMTAIYLHLVDGQPPSKGCYDGSYKSVRKFVRVRYGRPRIRPFRRVETPPGVQTQSDWGEFRRVELATRRGRRLVRRTTVERQ